MPTINKGRRDMPEGADFYGWKSFERWADRNGVGEHPDYWMTWWMCWKTAYVAGVNQL